MANRVDQASRIIRAKPSKIYQAFESPSALESWLPPRGMTGNLLSFSFREGGGYRMRLSYDEPGGSRGKTSENSDEVEVSFLRLEENSRIEQVVNFDSENPEFAGLMKMTWSFVPVTQGTEVVVRCENVPEGIRPEDHEAGLRSSLGNLADFNE